MRGGERQVCSELLISLSSCIKKEELRQKEVRQDERDGQKTVRNIEGKKEELKEGGQENGDDCSKKPTYSS